MTAVFFSSSDADKRKIYLINHDPIEHLNRIQIVHALGKFVVEQTIREFRSGSYNDGVLGELYSLEEQARRRVYADEYYLELLVPAQAILEVLQNDRVLIKPDFTPQILALKTLQDKNYLYDQEKKVFRREKESRTLLHAETRASQSSGRQPEQPASIPVLMRTHS